MRPAGGAATIGLLSILLLGCPKEAPRATAEDAGARADAAAEAGASENESDVEPVYPIEANAPVVPLAEKLCAGLSEMPEKKRAACCNATPGIVVTSECTRMLGAAIRHHAVELTEKDVDACIAAFEKTLDGCEWVGPFAPGPPAACMGILKGKLAAGQKCRSSLECSGTLRCHGVGPTTPGTCGAPKPDGELCGTTVDTLASFTREGMKLDALHPECSDRCIKHKCAPAAQEGASCLVSADCAKGLMCMPTKGPAPKVGLPPKTCIVAAMPKDGEACPSNECADGLSCLHGKCAARKGTGAACTSDFECRGGCLKGDAGDKGSCGPRCDLR
jgi:hypothetical protein